MFLRPHSKKQQKGITVISTTSPHMPTANFRLTGRHWPIVKTIISTTMVLGRAAAALQVKMTPAHLWTIFARFHASLPPQQAQCYNRREMWSVGRFFSKAMLSVNKMAADTWFRRWRDVVLIYMTEIGFHMVTYRRGPRLIISGNPVRLYSITLHQTCGAPFYWLTWPKKTSDFT